MKTTSGAWGLMIAASLLVSGCSKKDGGATAGAAETEKTPAPTGIKGTFKGAPWAGKTAWLKPDTEGASSKVYVMAGNGQCKMPDIMGDEAGMMQLTSVPKKGLTPFDKDNTYAEFFWKKGNSMSSFDTSHGEIEWIKIPTATTKGLVRVKMEKAPDTKVEGSMEVALCPKK